MVPYLEFLNVNHALSGPIPDLIIAAWQEVSADHRATGLYTSNLSFTRMFPYQGNPLTCAVANTTPYAEVLETGHAGFHLPSRIDWGASRSAKVNKKGRHYLRIPFRHMTPGRESEGISSLRMRTAMPREIHRSAVQQFRRSKVAHFPIRGGEQYGRLSRPYRVMHVPESLIQRAVREEGHPGYTWRAGKFEGMRRIVQRGASGSTSSQYMTWRTLSEDSVGWWIPAHPGFHFADRVVERIKGPVADIVSAAIANDIANVISMKWGGL